jgi:LysM repeat protein
MKPIHPLMAVALSAAPIIFSAGCQQRLDQQESFKEQVGRIDRLREDVDVVQGQLKLMDAELQDVSISMADVKKQLAEGGGAPGGGPSTVAIEQRLNKIDLALKNYSESLAALNSKIGQSPAQSAAPSAPARPAATPPANGGKTTLNVVPGGGGGSAPAVGAPRPAATPKPEPAPARGIYHSVKAGETIDTIAAQYKTTAGAIRQANRIPSGREAIPGQQLFVPQR